MMKSFNPSQYFFQNSSQSNTQMSEQEAISKLRSLNKSNKTIICWNPNFLFVNFRKDVFKNEIFNICQHLNYKMTTFYLSIAIFDNFMGTCLIQEAIVKCIPFICLQLASKLNEDYNTSLTLLDVQKIIPEFSFELIIVMEKVILEELDFNLNLNTIYHNLFYLLHLVETNLINYDVQTKREFIEKCFSIANSLVINYDTNKINPFITAITIIHIFGKSLNMEIQIEEIIGKITPVDHKIIGEQINYCEEFINDYFMNNSKSA